MGAAARSGLRFAGADRGKGRKVNSR